jgi:hypothetical protein
MTLTRTYNKLNTTLTGTYNCETPCMDHVASANCAFLPDNFFRNFVNALDLRGSKLTDFCFFKSETSDWKEQNQTAQYNKCHLHKTSYVAARAHKYRGERGGGTAQMLRKLNACVSLWRTGFNPRRIHVGCFGESCTLATISYITLMMSGKKIH